LDSEMERREPRSRALRWNFLRNRNVERVFSSAI
jgi:hypothetical protein